IYDPAGLVLTNYHLVEGAGIIQVSLADGPLLPAELVGRSACDDVAVLRLFGRAFAGLPLGTDPAGESLVAAGSPAGVNVPAAAGRLFLLTEPFRACSRWGRGKRPLTPFLPLPWPS